MRTARPSPFCDAIDRFLFIRSLRRRSDDHLGSLAYTHCPLGVKIQFRCRAQAPPLRSVCAVRPRSAQAPRGIFPASCQALWHRQTDLALKRVHPFDQRVDPRTAPAKRTLLAPKTVCRARTILPTPSVALASLTARI